jgi:DNA integrity scanning protein DisA with diadenylate cyclase activity
MKNKVNKFYESSFFTKSDLKDEYDLTPKDIEKIIEILEKYKLDSVLLSELNNIEEKEYKTLRKWKIISVMKRYESLKPKLDEIELIEDYLLEITDEGHKVYIHYNEGTIDIYFSTKGMLKSLNSITTCLLQLSNRLKVDINEVGEGRTSGRYIMRLSYELIK